MPRGRKGKLDKVRCYISSSKCRKLMECLPEFKDRVPAEEENIDSMTISEVFDAVTSLLYNTSFSAGLPQGSVKYAPQSPEFIEEEEPEEEIEEDSSAYDIDDF
jgi:hypothetical protein